ncbi:cytochrome b [Salinisphaera sp. Q1T1-3]|uniref:cytochrome b n=1 Tax=Salinisphaera sp. Q1T1-3 TaxID=2321229 RepID=UPI000E7561AF|nr:cytochrome b/b6 domain-containing protein [Salinisphaera sp. Q1T1-3]RJS93572.1 cytochrome b [Salinisphaera sp. Q1T1-3]
MSTSRRGQGRWADRPARYGTVTRWLHWAVAVLLLMQFTTVLSWRWVGDTPATRALSSVAPHGLVGLTVFGLMLARLAWGWRMRALGMRPTQPGTWTGHLARAGHITLNMLTLLIPGTAILRAWASGHGMAVWGVRWIPSAEREMLFLEAPADLLHSTMAWGLLFLALGHAGAALYHHAVLRDRTLDRIR